MARSIPEQHFPAGNGIDVRTEIIIRTEDNLGVLRKLIHYLLGIGRGNNYIREGFDVRARIHITYHNMIRMLRFESRQIFRFAAIRQ